MIEYSLYSHSIEEKIIKDYLSENCFVLKFSFNKKVYYNFIRPIIPLFLRHYIQKFYNSKITFNKNFIWDEFVNFLQQDKEKWENFIIELYPEIADCIIVITHDVETQKGFEFIPKVIELEQKYNFKSSWNLVPYKYNITDDIVNEIRKNGDEIGIHGYNHDGKLYYSEKIFNQRVPYINDALRKYNAVGFRSPMVHRNLEWLQQLNILYDASCFDYDPFQPFPGGNGSIWPFIAGKFVELPYTLPQDHTMFYVLNQKDISIWKNKVDWIVKNHGMILIITHPDYLQEKYNLKYYEELLAYLNEIKNTWRCLPKEIAEWWVDKFSGKTFELRYEHL